MLQISEELRYNDGIQIVLYNNKKVIAEAICAHIFKKKLDFNILEEVIEDTFYMDDFTFEGLGIVDINQFISKKALKIDILSVRSKYQKCGYGSFLLNRVFEVATDKGYTDIYLNSSPMGNSGLGFEELMGFYRGFGFEMVFNMDNLNALMVKHI